MIRLLRFIPWKWNTNCNNRKTMENRMKQKIVQCFGTHLLKVNVMFQLLVLSRTIFELHMPTSQRQSPNWSGSRTNAKLKIPRAQAGKLQVVTVASSSAEPQICMQHMCGFAMQKKNERRECEQDSLMHIFAMLHVPKPPQELFPFARDYQINVCSN